MLPDARDARVVGDLEQPVAGLVERRAARPCARRRRPPSSGTCRSRSARRRGRRGSGGRRPGPWCPGGWRARSRARIGATNSMPTEVATRSNARLSRRDERDRPKRRMPSIVIPSTSSNSTEEPTTSNIRGRTLTRTPAALATRIRLDRRRVASVVVGAMTIRCTSSSRTSSRTRSSLPSTSMSSPTSGSDATTAARARLDARALVDAIRALGLADHETALDRRGAAREPPRECASDHDRRRSAPSHSPAIWSPPSVPLDHHRLQNRHPEREERR